MFSYLNNEDHFLFTQAHEHKTHWDLQSKHVKGQFKDAVLISVIKFED